MTEFNLIKKIEELDYWLESNVNSPNFQTICDDRRALRGELEERQENKRLRIDVLSMALELDREVYDKGFFSEYERWMIHKERAYHLSCGSNKEQEVYAVEKHIEDKINKLIK